ncbi:hypothetical protein AB0G73_19810 [Streptomyces sp. NPDC020719]|uniref:hypothetical protein n=1 Tax=Streptomyces sp. NPDC020719 TaxID=3154896 RepID=UPI00340669B7
MKATRGITASLAVLAMAAAGCGKSAAVPKEFCGVPVKQGNLAPLLPDSKKFKNWNDSSAAEYADCDLTADGSRVLSVTIKQVPKPLGPDDWVDVRGSKPGARRSVSFPGTAVISADEALVTADCGHPTPYVLFRVLNFRKDQPEKYAAETQELQRFVEDFVPQITERIGCEKTR